MSIAFGTLVGGLGGESTIIYWGSRERRRFTTWLPGMVLWGLLGSTLACGLWVVAFWKYPLAVLKGITPEAGRIVLLSIPAAILFSYSMALLAGLERFRLRSLCALARQVAGIAGFLGFYLLLGKRVEVALWGNFSGMVAGSVAAIAILRREVREFWRIDQAARNLGATLWFGVRGQIGNLATFFTYRFDVFIVNYFLPPAQLGYYALGVVVSEALWQIPSAVGSALFPRTARTEEEHATRFTAFVMRQIFLLTLAAGAVVALICPVAVPLVFGKSFQPSVAVIWWILPGTIALALSKVGCADLAGRGKTGYSSIFAMVTLVVTLSLDWLLIPRMGIIGAALASSVAYTVNSALVLLALRYEMKASWRELVVPTREEFQAYAQLWHRARGLAGMGGRRSAEGGRAA